MINKPIGGEDPPAPLTPQQRQEWNRYVDFLEKKGYKGSALLDKRDTGLATGLFNLFKKENPNVSLSLDHIKSVQAEMNALASAARSFEARRGNPNAKNIMQGTSIEDGWAGSKTTSFKFPSMEKEESRNGVLQSRTNFGVIDPRLRPTDSTKVSMTTPTGIKLEKMSDGYYYEDPKTGELVKYNK